MAQTNRGLGGGFGRLQAVRFYAEDPLNAPADVPARERTQAQESAIAGITPTGVAPAEETVATMTALGAAHRERIAAVLQSAQPLDAYDLLRAYPLRRQNIPDALMTGFFQAVRRLHNPLAVHLFASLVTVDQVGRRHFIANVGRVVKLHIAVRNWEQCLHFVREVELINKGDLQLPYDTLEAILVAARWHNDVDIGLQCVQIMHDVHPHVYARSWGMLLQLALDSHSYAALDWVFEQALKPGYLVLDDRSYLRVAHLASQHGNLRICEWAGLRMRRRQKAFHASSPTTSLQLYVCLVEAAARSSLVRTETVQASIRAVSRYLVRLSTAAQHIRVAELPQVLEALTTSSANLEYFKNVFAALIEDTAVDDQVKTLTFNLLLAAELGRGADTNSDAAVEVARTGRAHDIGLNEDSILLLLDLAVVTSASRDAISKVVLQAPTRRVLRKADHILKTFRSS